MKISENKTFIMKVYGEELTMRLRKGEYLSPNNTALVLECMEDGYWETYIYLTTNIIQLAKDKVTIDRNNLFFCWDEIVSLIEDNDLGVFTGVEIPSGFCQYPILLLDMENVNKFCEVYA